MNHKKKAICFLMLWSVALLVFSGCGKKGLPLAPEIKGQKIAAPFDLKVIPGDNGMILNWRHQTDNETALLVPDGFDIFCAKRTIEACAGCPFEFEMIGSVLMPSMEFGLKTEKGYKYYFRVQAFVQKSMLRSEYSKTLQFEDK